MFRHASRIFPFFSVAAAAGLILYGCDFLNDNLSSSSANRGGYLQVNLVSDTAFLDSAPTGAAVIDKDLANPWGIWATQTGNYWIADNHTGKASFYSGTGVRQMPSITIPGPDDAAGAPTGLAANTTNDFVVPGGARAVLIFAGEDGTVSAWDSGTSARVVFNDSGAVLKGIALASDSGRNFIYLADFKGRKIDVYDGAFQKDSTRRFSDSTLPSDFGPFNIVLVDSQLYVTYAKQKGPDDEDDTAGAGNGYVNVFTTGGALVKRFASGGPLNSPWGLAWVPESFGDFKNAIYIGNFGDGMINVYDKAGTLLGQVKDASGNAIKIDGLWGLYHRIPAGSLYFTAGPGDENHGLFGFLTPQ
jgi:uncharacterized protein (TIGR03118 family)